MGDFQAGRYPLGPGEYSTGVSIFGRSTQSTSSQNQRTQQDKDYKSDLTATAKGLRYGQGFDTAADKTNNLHGSMIKLASFIPLRKNADSHGPGFQ